MKNVWLGAVSAAALICAAVPALAADPVDLSKPVRLGPIGLDPKGGDKSVAPTKDFYQSVNGGYLATLEIPADRTRFGPFDVLNELSQDRMKAIVEEAAADKTATGNEAKIGAFYRAYVDEAAVDALGAKPLAGELAAIKAIRTKGEMAAAMGAAQRKFGGAFFGAYVHDDAKDPETYAAYLAQSGLGLPDRDYYLEEKFAAQKAAYEVYVAKILALAAWERPAENAKAIVAMETEIAKVSWTGAERRDDDKTYNPYEIDKLVAYAPGFDWKAYLNGAGLKTNRVIVAENTAFPKIAAIYAAAPLETLKAWEAFNTADQAAPYLSKDFDDAAFEFRNKTLSGQKAQQPRWKRAVTSIDANLGEALGKLYVEAYFPAQDKAKMEALVGDILKAMSVRIDGLDWMSAPTKAKAQEKLSKFRVKIAYPDKWRDYSGLEIKDGDLFGNIQRSSAFEWDYRAARLGGPVDDEEWGITTPTINAYYQSTKNEIVFPAAILQPPFFDPQADPAINYGGIGAVIGHEVTHGFDDQGRKSDGDGRLSDWWSAEDAAKFKIQAEKFGKQYSAIEPLPGAHIDGDLTMGENIADLGGLLLGLEAYHISLKGKPAPVIDGLTGDQRVFMGWAQIWRAKSRDDRMRKQLVSDPHSPEKYRVNVPVANIDAFYAAFGVKPGDAMYIAPGDRVRIW